VKARVVAGIGIAGLIGVCAVIVVFADPFDSGDSPDVAAIVSPTQTSRPSVTFYPTPTETETLQSFVSVNGLPVPIPPGAGSQILPLIQIPDAYVPRYISLRRGNSTLEFRENGWLTRVDIAPEDEVDLAPTLDAIELAAESVTVGPVTFRLPRGMRYRTPMLIASCSHAANWIGPPVESPQNHIFRVGQSYLAFGVCDGSFIRDIQPDDEEAFRPVLEMLGLPVYG
jgi:hypothetical protein